MNPAIGTMVCPLSVIAKRPHEATIHQQNSKRKPYYWRCACGTMQPLLEDGQALMAVVMQSTSPEAKPEPAEEDAPKKSGDQAESAEPESPAPKPKSAIESFLFGGDDDE